MGGLFASLDTASTALRVFSRALNTEQTNVANASSPGYAAQSVNILPIGFGGNAGANGDFIQLSSPGSAFADAAVRAASSQASESQTQANVLSPVNQLFDITGTTGILGALQQFGTAFSQLSVSPNDPALGSAAINAASHVALAFQSTANSLGSQQAQLDSTIQTTTAQINSLAAQISQLNAQSTNLSSAADPVIGANLRNSLDQLSSLVDITVTNNPNGTVSVLAGGQLPLVIGDQAYALSADPTAAGSQVTSSGGGSSPGSFSGQLGALLQVQNGTLDALLGSGTNPGTLNTLAAGFASRVNTLLTSGVTATGAAGVPLFTYDTVNPQNAAATLAVDPTVTPSALGLASTGASGVANGIANQLAALPASTAPADQISGYSAEGLFGSIAASVGQQLSAANTAATGAQTTLTGAQTSRQQQIGVSLDQEAVNITADERAWQANAQVVSVLSTLTQTAVDLIK